MHKLITSMVRISIFTCLAILAGTLFLLPRITSKRVHAANLCQGSCGENGSGGTCAGRDGTTCLCINTGGPIGQDPNFQCLSETGPFPIDGGL